jgi:single-stranded-DNA-specific exonuclease
LPAVAKVWQLLPHDADAIARLASALRTSPVVAQLLLNRGLTDPEAARRFLDAPLAGLHPPQLLPGVNEAVERIAAAVAEKRRIWVYGDYDVDGLTGTAILWRLLKRLGADVGFYVPNRLEEGYGLSREALRTIAEQGPALVVTVDCGIASVGPAAEARKLGLELIVTDHHEPKETLPDAVLVHPRLPGSAYPFGGLSGAGVAFKLAWALCQKLSGGGERVDPALRDFLVEATSLAALGLVADVVPLHDENRIFVRHGLEQLGKAPPVGLKALLAVANLGGAAVVRADDVAYRLAPRLNAAGRLGCAKLVVELLTTATPQQAADIADFLELQNRTRQDLERRITEEAKAKLERDGYGGDPALVLADADWHPGVIGIVAGRLADQYARPVLLIAGHGETMPGSGRSVPGFALHEALAACGADLVTHGGHAAAAGFRIRPDRIDSFRRRFCDYAAAHFPEGPPPPVLTLDAEVPLSALTWGLLRDLDKLEPYGAQNARPKFLAGNLELVGDPRRIGAGERHLNFRVRQGTTAMRVVAWGLGERWEELMRAPDRRCSLAFTPRINEWNGNRTIELEAIDFQVGPEAKLG